MGHQKNRFTKFLKTQVDQFLSFERGTREIGIDRRYRNIKINRENKEKERENRIKIREERRGERKRGKEKIDRESKNEKGKEKERQKEQGDRYGYGKPEKDERKEM